MFGVDVDVDVAGADSRNRHAYHELVPEPPTHAARMRHRTDLTWMAIGSCGSGDSEFATGTHGARCCDERQWRSASQPCAL